MTTTMTEMKSQHHSGVHHPFIYLGHEYLPFKDASIPITTQAFNYGTGVFEGIRAYLTEDGNTLNVFRLNEHIERFMNSSKLLLIDSLPSHQEMKEIIIGLLRKNQANMDIYIRPIAFKFTQAVILAQGAIPKDKAHYFLNSGFTKQNMLDVILGISQKTMSTLLNSLSDTPIETQFMDTVEA